MLELAFISPPDMMVVMVVALLVFGPKRLPEVGRQVGQFTRDARKMMAQFTDAFNDVNDEVKRPARDVTPVVPDDVKPATDEHHTDVPLQLTGADAQVKSETDQEVKIDSAE